MSENIAGYADKTYVKGQYYKYAASPKPVTFTGDIDEVSDDLLTKAMFVTRGQVVGTLPSEAGNTFLIETIRYGNDTYLQTAYLVQTGYDCYEYRRIYSNNQWTNWVGVDSEIKAVDDKIEGVKTTADSCDRQINGSNGISTQISNLTSSVNTINNNSIPTLSTRIASLDSRVGSVESKTNALGTAKLYEGVLRSGSINIPDNYKTYLVVGMVLDGGSRTSQLHPRSQITTDTVKYLLADTDEWVRYIFKDSGNHILTITFDGKSASYHGGGAILQVWGIT